MKDTVISAKTKKRELTIYAVCFAIAFILNIYSIISFDRSWIELLTQIGFVIAISIVIYIVISLIRIAVYLALKIFKK